MSDLTIPGRPIASMTDGELERAIDRAIEQAADAMKYSGPGGAAMYRNELLSLATVRAARRMKHTVTVTTANVRTNAIGGPAVGGRGVR